MAQSFGILGVRRVVDDLPTPPVETVETLVLGADPQNTRLVLKDAINPIAGKAMGVSRVVPVDSKGLTLRVIDIHPAPSSREPDQAGPVGDNLVHIVFAQARG